MKKKKNNTTQIVIRMSVEEKDKLKSILADKGKTISEWVREKIKGLNKLKK